MLSTIHEAAQNRRTLIFDYNKKTDGTFEAHVEIEPYSIRAGKDGDLLFGWEITKAGMRSYYLDRTFNVRVGDRVFTPRYPVEL